MGGSIGMWNNNHSSSHHRGSMSPTTPNSISLKNALTTHGINSNSSSPSLMSNSNHTSPSSPGTPSMINGVFNSRKQREFIPDNKKDDSYWDRRRRNNEVWVIRHHDLHDRHLTCITWYKYFLSSLFLLDTKFLSFSYYPSDPRFNLKSLLNSFFSPLTPYLIVLYRNRTPA